jgi:UDP-glucose 4-epimerase
LGACKKKEYLLKMQPEILIAGGAGYIGSHAALELHAAGYKPLIVDNLSEGHREAVVCGELLEGDLKDPDFLDQVFECRSIQGVMHFASKCFVGESMSDPAIYYEENLSSALSLLRSMRKHKVNNFIFSSSCATYGNPISLPLQETHPQDPVNPYGETKYFIERILKQYDRAYGLRFCALRYFNAAGASLDGRIGESHDPETHLIPRILGTVTGKYKKIHIFGDDYPTADGTCLRDYIHVADLASAHRKALQWISNKNTSGFFNLGTGTAYSVRQILDSARKITGADIPVETAPRRPGDPPELVADPGKAKKILGWKPEFSSLNTIMESAWNWEQIRRY